MPLFGLVTELKEADNYLRNSDVGDMTELESSDTDSYKYVNAGSSLAEKWADSFGTKSAGTHSSTFACKPGYRKLGEQWQLLNSH